MPTQTIAMIQVVLYITAILSLIGTFFLTALGSAFRHLPKKNTNEQLKRLGRRFFYRPMHHFFFPERENEGLFFVTLCAQTITRFCYSAAVILLLMHSPFVVMWYIGSFLLILLLFTVGDYLPRALASHHAETAMRLCAPIASPFLFLAFPIAYLFLKLPRSLSITPFAELLEKHESEAEREILDIVREEQLTKLDKHERRLFSSVLSFRNRIVREVMVPRVDVFSLSEDTPIYEAAKLIEEEGYSRIPVYQNTVDNIVGVLMHKDIVNKYAEYAEKKNDANVIEAPISSIQKPVLYTPETKKISMLLQEFRKKQVHLAIVVDEYGGTEGIVTIEDILEEIVGEIADEYDIEEELFLALPDGSWAVDARMNISDAEHELSIKIPQTGDYDTIGGYIFHRAGTIPSKGFIIHHDDFELEILRSNDRCVEKVRIRPIMNKSSDQL